MWYLLLPGLRFVVTKNLIGFDEIKLSMTLNKNVMVSALQNWSTVLFNQGHFFVTYQFDYDITRQISVYMYAYCSNTLFKNVKSWKSTSRGHQSLLDTGRVHRIPTMLDRTSKKIIYNHTGVWYKLNKPSWGRKHTKPFWRQPRWLRDKASNKNRERRSKIEFKKWHDKTRQDKTRHPKEQADHGK